jgi:hypothetical protein
MNSDLLLSDCRFLDQVSAHQHRVSLPRPQEPRRSAKDVVRYCESCGITLLRLPRESSRSRENKTRLSADRSHLLWTTRWRFRRADRSIAFENVLSWIHEDLPLGDVFRAIVETAPNDEVAMCSPANSTILLVAEGAEGGGYYGVDGGLGLRANLFAKTVIEFPFFEIVPSDALGDWRIVTPLDVKKVHPAEPEAPAGAQPPTDLPTYQEIKKALKLDIIQGVLDRAADEAIRNAPLPD